MSDESDSEDHLGSSSFYGKALEPYDEETIPKKRAIAIEDQVAKDAQGRRRFHGAFTGGFSAGFFNTVGSLEGWRPTEFKSSRSSKAENKQQRAQDYMDEEDMGEFGIAPQTVKATTDYNTSKKRRKQTFSDGPIPGEPVLQTLINSGNETIGYLLLRNMGYKHGDDEDENVKEDDIEDIEIEDGSKRVYGCEMPKSYKIRKDLNQMTSKMHETYITALANPKANTFGMSYQGLDRGHINLFTSSKLVVNERNNKKLSITGQAFGVGAFEDDDEDIYVKEDLSKYDFEMTSEKLKEKPKDTRKLVLDLFVKAQKEVPMIEKFLPPTIPSSFTGKHKVKKSRFEPQQTQTAIDKEPIPKRHEIDATTRAMILGEETSNTNKSKSLELPQSTQIQPTPPIKMEEQTSRASMFDVGPSGLIFDKFVSASKSEEHTELMQPVQSSDTTHGTQDMREAAKMKMFGPLTRITESWLPNSLLCKRFNVPETTFGDTDFKVKQKRHRNLIFESASNLANPVQVDITFKSGLQTQNSNNSLLSTAEISLIETISEPASNSLDSTNQSIATIPQPSIEHESKIEEKKAIDPTEKLDISKNVDLFKAVFMDSDSDEEDNTSGDNDKTVDKRNDEEGDKIRNEEERRIRDEEIKAKILSEDLLLPQIKPIKQGILSNVETIIFDKPTVQEQPKQASPEQQPTKIIDESIKDFITSDNTYGPSLPAKITYRKPVKSTNLLSSNEASNSDSDWVEKADDKTYVKSHKHKKQKKNKKEKHKHKNKRKDKR